MVTSRAVGAEKMCSAVEMYVITGDFGLRALMYSQKGDALQRDVMEVPVSCAK